VLDDLVLLDGHREEVDRLEALDLALIERKKADAKFLRDESCVLKESIDERGNQLLPAKPSSTLAPAARGGRAW
jgi:hypothetical protein